MASDSPFPASNGATNAVSLLVGAPLLVVNRALLAAGLTKRRDGWRRATGLVLRGEASTFVLSAFGLDAWSGGERPLSSSADLSQARIAGRLHQSFAGEPACCVRIRRSRDEDRAETGVEPCYTLAFAPWIEGSGRFVPPAAGSWLNGAAARGGGVGDTGVAPLMNVVCRVSSTGTCDVWLRINHAGTDGVPMQEALTRLEAAWGMAEPVVYPTPEGFAPFERPRASPGRAGLAEVQFFADFGPLLAWRKRQNAGLAEPMTVSAALLWWLADVPALRARRIGTTVEVGAVDGLPRGVGVVVVRPADYHAQQGGLAEYVRGFNRQLDLNRRRVSDGCKTLDAAAQMPARLARALLRFALSQTTTAFGTLGVTMLKDARVFGAPIAEAGHGDGFIAVGSVSLPSTDGRAVGCVTVKGPAGAIAEYPSLIRAAIARCGEE